MVFLYTVLAWKQDSEEGKYSTGVDDTSDPEFGTERLFRPSTRYSKEDAQVEQTTEVTTCTNQTRDRADSRGADDGRDTVVGTVSEETSRTNKKDEPEHTAEGG